MVADTTDKVEAVQKDFSAMRTNVPKLKKTYEGKCKELDAAEEENQAAVRPPAPWPRYFFPLLVAFD